MVRLADKHNQGIAESFHYTLATTTKKTESTLTFSFLFFCLSIPSCAAINGSSSKQSGVKCSLQSTLHLVGCQLDLVLCTCLLHSCRSLTSFGKENKLIELLAPLEHPYATHFFPIIDAVATCTCTTSELACHPLTYDRNRAQNRPQAEVHRKQNGRMQNGSNSKLDFTRLSSVKKRKTIFMAFKHYNRTR